MLSTPEKKSGMKKPKNFDMIKDDEMNSAKQQID
jgi:hypothetical protein